jgi:hypothetical protein
VQHIHHERLCWGRGGIVGTQDSRVAAWARMPFCSQARDHHHA